MLCIDILRSVPWTVVRPSGCFLLFLSCIVFLFSSAAALVANKDYYYYYYIRDGYGRKCGVEVRIAAPSLTVEKLFPIPI